VGEKYPWKTEVIEGDPIQVGERQLVPIIRKRSIFRRQVTFGTEASSGGGGGLVWLQPVAVIERQPDGSQMRIPISNQTGIALNGMLIGALTLPVLYLFVVGLISLRRRRPLKGQA
jgi:uncharacterized spore protein YtfJ